MTDPARSRALYEQAIELFKEGRLEEAIQTAGASLENDPSVDPLEKIERFKKVIALDPHDVLGYYSLGEAYLDIKKYPEAVEAFRKGLETDPLHSSSYYGLGQAYQALGEKEKACEIFEKGIRVADERGDVMTMKKIEARLNQLSSDKS